MNTLDKSGMNNWNFCCAIINNTRNEDMRVLACFARFPLNNHILEMILEFDFLSFYSRTYNRYITTYPAERDDEADL